MARTDTLGHFLTDVADAIREKKGTSETIVASDFDTEIANLPSGGDTPTKGVIFSQWDSDGYPTKAEIVGITEIPNYYFISSNSNGNLFGRINKVILPNDLTSIGWSSFSYMKFTEITLPSSLATIMDSAFSYCINLTSVVLPSSITKLGRSVFTGCTYLTEVTLPSNISKLDERVFNADTRLETINLDNIITIAGYVFTGCQNLVITKLYAETIGDQAFMNCKAIKKLCLPNIKSMRDDNQNYASFRYCTSLKQLWIGANIATKGLGRYPFSSCTALEKIYINLPRATVEAMTGYSYAFCNDTSKTGIIVCNDDTGFITEQEFDELVIE